MRSSCRCSLCATSPNGLARRAPTSPVLRGIRQGDIFLVFSSTIAFEAAVIDSVMKDARAKHWEKVIAEGRERVDAVEADHERRLIALLNEDQTEEPEAVNYKARISDMRADTGLETKLDWTWEGVFSWASRHKEMRAALGFQDWRGPPLSILRRLSAPEILELLSDNRILHRFFGGPDCANLVQEPPSLAVSTQKIRTQEWSVTKMVIQLLSAANPLEQVTLPSDSPPVYHAMPLVPSIHVGNWRTELARAKRMLDILYNHSEHSNFYERIDRPLAPRYEWDNDTRGDDLINLNSALDTTLQQLTSEDRLHTLMAEVCQRLLLSRTPPNIHTYNLLLVRFCRLGRASLVYTVLESMEESHIRPNEITHATVLRFFTVTDNRDAFHMYVRRMEGWKRGLALADPNTTYHPLVEHCLRRFGVGKRKIAVKARMNQEVYTALIVGFLRFCDTEDAMYWYRGMEEHGWKPSSEMLVTILETCYRNKDWAGGVSAWLQFGKEALKLTRSAYEWMLRLCKRCGHPRFYSMVLDDGVRKGAFPTSLLDTPLEDHFAQFQTRVESKALMKPAQGGKIRLSPHVIRFAEKQGHYMLDNTISKAAHAPIKVLDDALRALDHHASAYVALKATVGKLEKKFAEINENILTTTEMVHDNLPFQRESMVKYSIGLRLKNVRTDDAPPLVQHAYNVFRKSAKSKVEERARVQNLPCDSVTQSKPQIDKGNPPLRVENFLPYHRGLLSLYPGPDSAGMAGWQVQMPPLEGTRPACEAGLEA